jgi:dTDP-4-amino-4,6-dideoxygalactose transaminase|uniref:DegT/DnrJ/EryC1/StrS family aminotransferase n=1 Tax=Candidatus Caldatribacterium californiense TaxID=1454726 RepID=A0A7V3YI62_9BACT
MAELALFGGKPLNTEPFPMWPSFSEKTKQEALKPLETGLVNYWTGTKGVEFEERWAAYCGCKFGVSTTNGTSALHTALAACEIGPGDEVIVPSYSFIASAFCVLQAGAIPVFADVRKDTHTLDPEDVARKITPRTRAILPVHLYGIPCDMDELMAVAKAHNLFVIEDCAQAHGSEYKGKKVGSIGHAGAFSFCQSKHFTTGGEGGCVVTNDEDIFWRAKSFRDHGFNVKERLRLLELERKLFYIHERVGFNYRMTEIQSIIGLCELERFETWNKPRRIAIGEKLLSYFEGHEAVLYLPPHRKEGKYISFWLFPVVLDTERIRCSIKEFWQAIEAEGVPVAPVLWPQMYREEAFLKHNGFGRAKFPFRSKEYTDPKSVEYDKVHCPNAAWLEERTFCFPCHPVYEDRHVDLMIAAFDKVYQYFRR